ncbi:MAG: amidohydrolase [Gammaproteobacteria bacterium]|nr:MAG: amidohydrolase [Gammaproteobacteria bacterium]
MLRSLFLICLLVIGVAGCGDSPEATLEPMADRVLTGGVVVTVDPERPDAEAVAIRDGRIQAVGTPEAIGRLVGPDTDVIDLEGRVVLPGFIEGHGHFLGLGDAQMILDLQRTASFEMMIEQVAEAAAEAEPGAWILGRGWHQERWDPVPEPAYDGVATHHAMSAVSPDNPVLLTHASGHASFANARAMALAGIDRDSEDPAGGTIVRDEDGEPTGFLRQAAQMPVRRVLQQSRASMTEAERQTRFLRQVELAGAEALRHGVTSFHDQGTGFEDLDRLIALADEGGLPIRLHVAVRGESNADMDQRLPDYRRVGYGDHFLTIRSIKRAIDGALGTHGAWLLEPYTDKPDTSGLPQTPLESLRETAEVALRHGFQLNTHAIGDRGNREALNVYEDVLRRDEAGDRRWRIEHAQNLHPDEVPRFAALGVIASMQGIHATSDGPWVPQRLGAERARQRAYVWRSLLDAEAVICNGTDVPVEPISPLASYHASVSRMMANGERFFPEQSMERLEALRSYTIGCAQAVFEEDLLGTITPGKFADLVVLDGNPLTVAEDLLPSLQVEMTLVGGDVRYRR